MRVVCRHGHFAFYPDYVLEVSAFSDFHDQDLVMENDYYTFEGCAEAPNYSLTGMPYMNLLPAIVTYAGKPWEVFRENGFVYNLLTGLVVPKLAIAGVSTMPSAGRYFVPGVPILQPGVRGPLGLQILSYEGDIDVRLNQIKIRAFYYE